MTTFDAALLGGSVHGTGKYHAAATAKDMPSYTLEAQFDKLSSPAVGQLLGLRFSGGTFDANSKMALFTSIGSMEPSPQAWFPRPWLTSTAGPPKPKLPTAPLH